MRQRRSFWRLLVSDVLVIVLAPIWISLTLLLLLIFPFLGAARWLQGKWLLHCFEQAQGRAGKRVLFIYSDSPNWKEYIETNILPKISSHAVVMNWSKRQEWEEKAPLEAKIFKHWAGDKEVNPIAILIPQRGGVSTIRFWQAFRDARHGKTKSIQEREEELFGFIRGLSHA